MNTPRCFACALALALAAICLTGCPSSQPGGGGTGGTGGGTSGGGASSSAEKPSFTLAWSEYPSWSVFGVADKEQLIDGDEGELGPVEEKWGVDIVLKEASYDSCLNFYAGNNVDAVCITNMDVLNPALSRKSVAILPTSTSNGADACIVVGIDDIQALRDHQVYGLENTVSQYCFARNLELQGEREEDHQFTNMDPAAASVAMINGSPDHRAIVVWNPFVLQTLKEVPEARVLFDSSTIPGEIIDMVVVSEESLNKPGGKDFAAAVIDVYYRMNASLADPADGDRLLVALGEEFSSLGLEDMKKAVVQTKFYADADAGLALFTGEELPEVMTTVVDFCVDHKIVTETPTLSYGASGAGHLRFDPSFMEEVRGKSE